MRNIALILCLVSVSAGNPFATGSDVVTLNPSNWKQLEKSPLVWFVNVCREG